MTWEKSIPGRRNSTCNWGSREHRLLRMPESSGRKASVVGGQRVRGGFW